MTNPITPQDKPHTFGWELESAAVKLIKKLESELAKTKEELKQAKAEAAAFRDTLEALSKLGGGRSDGNEIAKKALSEKTIIIIEYP